MVIWIFQVQLDAVKLIIISLKCDVTSLRYWANDRLSSSLLSSSK